MEQWKGRVALVTGASSGIGREIVSKLASVGVLVIACARNLERLQEVAVSCKPGKVVPMKCDLSSEFEILEMFTEISSSHGGVDICINNAGFSHNAPLLSGNTEKWKDMLDVNVMALCICTRESVKQMKKRQIDDGFIINISSMAGQRMLNIPSSHFYMATKHMVRAVTEGVNNELRNIKSNIRVMEICPGVTETEFFERALGAKGAESVFKKNTSPLQPVDVANAVMYALSQPPHVQVSDILIRPTKSAA